MRGSLKPCALVAVIVFIVSSCQTLKVAENRNFSNTKEIGVEWYVTGKVKNVGDDFDQKLDSMMLAAMESYNHKQAELVFRRKEKKDKDYLTFEINQAKIVSAGGKTAGYIISGVGLIVAPVAILVASEYTFFLAFYYWPEHKLLGTVEVSGNLAAENKYKMYMGATKGALFGSNKKQVPMLQKRFVTEVENSFLLISTRLKQNETAGAGK
jgi:hypothetical protein